MSRRLTESRYEEFKRCRDDVVYTITEYGYLRTNEGSVRWNEPYPYQVEAWGKMQAGINIVINKTRQIGASWLLAAFAVWMLIFSPDIEILFLSETEKKAIRLLNIAKYVFRRFPSWMKPEVITDSQTRFAVRFSTRVNGEVIVSESSIDSLTTTQRAGASYTARLVIMDEMAHLPDGEKAFSAITPSTSHGGQMALASTPNGRDNVFFRVWNDAQFGRVMGFVPILAYWRDQGLTEEWFAQATEGLTTQQILQEFECQFLSAGMPFFDAEQLKACYRPREKFPVVRDTRGRIINEKTPISYTGVDVAGGERRKDGKPPDYTSIVTLNQYGVQIDAWHSNETAIPEVAGYVTQLAGGGRVEVDGIVTEWHQKYPGAMVIERWGPGESVYSNHVNKFPEDEVSYVVPRRTTGGRSSFDSKMRLLNNLRLAFAGGRIIITDEFTCRCLLSFEDKGNGKYEAAVGTFDDPVIALALAYDDLCRSGGFMLDFSDFEDAQNARMIGVSNREDISMDRLEELIPVGNIVHGPVFSEAGVDRLVDDFEYRKDLY